MWVDQENWVNDMAVDVLDEDAKEVLPLLHTLHSYSRLMGVSCAFHRRRSPLDPPTSRSCRT